MDIRWAQCMAPALFAIAVVAVAPAVIAAAGSAEFDEVGLVPVTPERLLDTRAGHRTQDEFSAGVGSLTAGETIDVRVAGHAGIPTVGVGAVVLNITTVDATANSYVTVFPAGVGRPNASTMNPAPGRPTPNLVVTGLSPDGDVSVYNDAGVLDVVIDVQGWFPATSAYDPLVPARLLDTRPASSTVDGVGAGGGRVGAGSTLRLSVAGRGGVPATGTGGVVLNVTAVDPSEVSYVTVHPSGAARPLASSLNPQPGQASPAMVVVPLGADGAISLFNAAGTTDLVVDVLGWFPSGPLFTGLQPARLLDTRADGATVDGQGTPAARVGPGGSVVVRVGGRGGVPEAGVRAVVVNVTAVGATAPTFVTLHAAGTARPIVSSLNPLPGIDSPNAAVVAVDEHGDIELSNDAGAVDLVVDVLGWFASGRDPSTWRQLAAGGRHTCAVRADHRVACWGANDDGQVQPAARGTDLSVPAPVGELRDVLSIAAGAAHSCALIADGSVWCWGDGAAGQRGDGATSTPAQPLTRVDGIGGTRSVSAGGDHTCAITLARSAVCWGANAFGESGAPASRSVVPPTVVPGLDGVVSLALGERSSCAVTGDGVAWCWGANDHGQLGSPTSGDVSSVPLRVRGLDDVSDLSVGANHACAIDAGDAVCWGWNSRGQLGTGSIAFEPQPVASPVIGVPPVSAIAAGAHHTCAAGPSGAWCWGDDHLGQTGVGPAVPVVVAPVAVEHIDATEGVVVAGDDHTCAVLTAGAIACWGAGDAGQLGHGATPVHSTPVLAAVS